LTFFQSQLKIGTVLANRYVILSRLGEGGMGAVFLANDLKLSGKQWAIKESRLHGDQAQGFADEAAILVKLDHLFLPKIIDFYPPDLNGFSYLVMDYIQGHSLQKLFEARKELSIEQVIRYAKQLSQVLNYLHEIKPKAIIYRDLKPSNVMIDQHDNIRLIDFGIARNYIAERNADTVQLGTIGFAAPEQYEQQQSDPRTDLYTLGALLFYLLNKGQHYSFQPAQIQVMTQQKQIPAKLTAIITKLLKINPDERYQSAAQVLTELEKISESKTDSKHSYLLSRTLQSQLPQKLIIVGGLYGTAGSTFVGIAIARILNHYAIPHALVENIRNQPTIFTLFCGDRHAPENYKFAADKINYESSLEKSPPWSNGYTDLYPLPPDGSKFDWNKELNYKLLYSIAQPVIILDVSDHWGDPLVIDLCRQADEVIVVAGPSLSRLNLPSTLQHIETLIDLQNQGKSVQCVANRLAPFSAQNEWLTSLPFHPICAIPEFEYAEVIQAEWSGKLFADSKNALELFNNKLRPLIKKIVPADHLSPIKILKKKAFYSWFK
jgi:serine/threonine protein kinase